MYSEVYSYSYSSTFFCTDLLALIFIPMALYSNLRSCFCTRTWDFVLTLQVWYLNIMKPVSSGPFNKPDHLVSHRDGKCFFARKQAKFSDVFFPQKSQNFSTTAKSSLQISSFSSKKLPRFPIFSTHSLLTPVVYKHLPNSNPDFQLKDCLLTFIKWSHDIVFCT